MIDLDELTAEAREYTDDLARSYGVMLIRRLADALEAATRAPVQGEPDDRSDIDAIENALYEVEGRHHIIGDACLCGADRLIKNRDKTKHIARETIAALMGRGGAR